MKKSTRTLVVFSSLIGFTLTGYAFTRDGGQFFDRIDSDGDGYISESEVSNFRKKVFNRMDKNGDGVFSGAENKALEAKLKFIQKMLQDQVDRLADADTNNDGEISEEEFANADYVLFYKMDSNEDGLVSQEEMTEFFKR